MASTSEQQQQQQQEQPMKYHVMVSTPCFACKMRKEFCMSILQLQLEMMKAGHGMSVDFLGNESLIPRGRNIMTQRFLNNRAATHHLFIDADIAFDPKCVLKLLQADKDIVCGAYPKKHIDWAAIQRKKREGSTEPVQAAGLDYNLNLSGGSATVTNGLVSVLDAATGFMLMKREAIQKMVDHYRPELLCVNDIASSNKEVPEYVAIWDLMIDPESKRYLSEDYSMCRRATMMGLEIFMDITIPLAHIGMMNLEAKPLQRFTLTLKK